MEVSFDSTSDPDLVDDFLSHHGVNGMKWRQRKAPDDVSTQIRNAGKAASDVVTILGKGDYRGNPVFTEDSKTTDTLLGVRRSIKNFLSKKNLSTLKSSTSKSAVSFITSVLGG